MKLPQSIIFTTVLFLNYYLVAKAGGETDTLKLRSRICFYFSPEFSHRVIGREYSDDIFQKLKTQQRPEMGYSVGFLYHHKIVRNHYLETGLSLAMHSINERFHPYEGYPVFDSLLEPQSIKSRYNFAFLNIPIQYKWLKSKETVSFGFFAGLRLAYLAYVIRNDWFNNSLSFKDEVLITDLFSRFTVFGNAGFLIHINATDNVNFEIRPHFRYQLSPTLSDVSYNFYSVGIEMNMGIHFNRKKIVGNSF